MEKSPSSPARSELDVEDYIENLPSGYQIHGTPVDPGGDSASMADPLGRPLSVHMVPSSSVRLVPTPEVPADACSPPASPPPSAELDVGLSAFSLAPSDTFSELVTNLISPYLVDSDGVLMTSCPSGADLSGASDCNWTVDEPPADSAEAPSARLTGSAPRERELPCLLLCV